MALDRIRNFEFLDVAADSDGVTTDAIEIDHPFALQFELENEAGGNALTGFSIQLLSHPNAAWYDYAEDDDLVDVNAGAWHLKPDSLTELHTLASGSTANCGIHVPAGVQLRFKLTSTSGATCNLRGRITNQ